MTRHLDDSLSPIYSTNPEHTAPVSDDDCNPACGYASSLRRQGFAVGPVQTLDPCTLGLITDAPNPRDNGVYRVVETGAAGQPFVMERVRS